MSEGAPIKKLPQQVEPRKLAYNQVTFHGVVKAQDLPRLAKTAQFTGDIRVCLDFSVDEQGRRMVIGKIDGDARLECQRCLQEMAEQLIQADVKVAIVWDEEESKQLPRDIDPWIVGEDEADFYALVEEELLLNLPVAAYHDYVCIDEDLLSHGSGEKHEVERKNPFSVLATMKNQTKREK